MDNLRREVEEKRDAEAEAQAERKIRELQDSTQGRLEEAINHGHTQHLRNLSKITQEQQNFVIAVEKMKEEDEEKHEAMKAEFLKQTEEKLEKVSTRCDAVTQAALNNLEDATFKLDKEAVQLEKDNIEAKAKLTEIEVDVGRRMFDQVDAQKDKDEYLSEKRTEELRNQHIAIQKEEENVLAKERAERKKNASMTISEIRSDLKEQQNLGLFNLSIQHSADDRKNRRQINGKVVDVQNFVQDLDQCYLRAIEVLGADPEIYAVIPKSKKRTTSGHLMRFIEILDSINRKLGEIEQNLASLELKDVQMSDVNRKIKTQISSFGKTIANLKLILELDGFPIDPKKTEEFTKAKEELFEQINNMSMISENRNAITQAIQQRQAETMPIIETLSIEN